jgi:hypothetical protein
MASALAVAPIFSSFSASIIALVVLQKSVLHGLVVLLVGVLPLSIWYIFQYNDYMLLLLCTMSFGLAVILRIYTDWEKVLLAGLPLIVLLNWLLISTQEDNIEQILAVFTASISETKVDMASIKIAMMYFLSIYAFIPLLIARWLQAFSYPANQFRREFQAIHLSIHTSVLLVIGAAFSYFVDFNILAICMLVPFIVAGISLIHFLVNYKKLASYWIIIFYFLLLTVNYAIFVVIVLGILDGILHIRNRI